MGRWFNENLMRATTWPKRGRESLRQELLQRKRNNTEEPPENPIKTGGSNMPKRVGGRPKLDIAVYEVLDALSKGNTVTQTARLLGISRQAVYRVIHRDADGNV